MRNNKERKVSVNFEMFDHVKRIYTTKTKQELLEITSLKQAERLKFLSWSSFWLSNFLEFLEFKELAKL